MPIHFNSFIPNNDKTLIENLFSNMMMKYIQNPENILASTDKRFLMFTSYIRETNSNEVIGKAVITEKFEPNTLEIIDVDITIKNDNATILHFEEKLEQSSEANEYYNVVSEEGSHFQIETVNRHLLDSENLENTEQKVYLSAFPFKLDIYDTEDEMNKALGFSEPIKIKDTDMYIHGYSTNMMAVGGMLTGQLDEPSSFIIGIIEDYKDITVNIADIDSSFTIIYIKTEIGILPVVAHRANFDLNRLQKGNILVMLADVKADFER